MRNTLLWAFVIMALLAGFGAQQLRISSMAAKGRKQKAEITRLSAKDENLFTIFKLQHRFNKARINQHAVINDEHGNTFLLKKLVNENNPKLILYFSNMTCDLCIKKESEIMRKFSDTLNKNILVFSHNLKECDALLFRQINKVDFPVFNVVNNDFIGVDKDWLTHPLIFVLHPNLTMSNVFIPEKTLPRLSEEYYNTVMDLWYR